MQLNLISNLRTQQILRTIQNFNNAHAKKVKNSKNVNSQYKGYNSSEENTNYVTFKTIFILDIYRQNDMHTKFSMAFRHFELFWISFIHRLFDIRFVISIFKLTEMARTMSTFWNWIRNQHIQINRNGKNHEHFLILDS